MKRLLLVLAMAVFLITGCATYGWVVPYNITNEQLQKDKRECYELSVMAPHSGVSSAMSFLTLGILGEQRGVREQRIYHRCLVNRNWRWEKMSKR